MYIYVYTSCIITYPSLHPYITTYQTLNRGGQQASLSSSNDNTSSSSTSNRRNRGAGIGSNGLVLRRNTNEESDEDDVEEGRERRGFDRLRSVR